MIKIIKKIYKKTFYRLSENIWLFIFNKYFRNKKINIAKNGSINN